VFLFEAYQQPYESVMAMPSSMRHRFVKIREEIVRTKGKPTGGAVPSYATGLDPRPQNPMTGPRGGSA
jgi:hypothetical protein